MGCAVSHSTFQIIVRKKALLYKFKPFGYFCQFHKSFAGIDKESQNEKQLDYETQLNDLKTRQVYRVRALIIKEMLVNTTFY